MNIYLQIFAGDQSPETIKLLMVPALLASGSELRASAKLAAGEIRRFASRNPGELSKKLIEARFNKAEVIYNLKRIEIDGLKCAVNHLNLVITPYPTSALWKPAVDCVIPNKASGFRQLHAKGLERSCSMLKLKRLPVVFEFAISLGRTGIGDDKVLDAIAQWVATAWPDTYSGLGLFGCCNAGGMEVRVNLLSCNLMLGEISESMGVSLTCHEQLGNKFSRLHPVMFGSQKTCLGIVEALGASARVITRRSPSNISVIRVVSNKNLISPEQKVKHWLIK